VGEGLPGLFSHIGLERLLVDAGSCAFDTDARNGEIASASTTSEARMVALLLMRGAAYIRATDIRRARQPWLRVTALLERETMGDLWTIRLEGSVEWTLQGARRAKIAA
jgi:hypothetical protein